MVDNSNTSDTSVAQVKTAERGSVIRQTFYVFRRWPILPMIVMVPTLPIKYGKICESKKKGEKRGKNSKIEPLSISPLQNP